MRDLFLSATVSPDAPLWRDAFRPRDLPTASRRFREQLGLDPNQPVVMSGHQPTIWHAGILAKWAAMAHAAEHLRAQPIWLVVDQDIVSPFEVRWPAATPNGLAARTTLFGASPADSSPACARNPLVSARLEALDGAPQSVARGLHAIADALARHGNQPTAAAQVAHSTRDLAGEALRTPPPVLAFASTLATTDAFRAILDHMERDAPACIAAYNRAAATHQHARIRPLDARRLELPLWRITPESRRERVFAGERDTPGALAPRALLTTLLARLHACDLFVHGTGGGGNDAREGYDLVMQDWARDWMGHDTRLAPVATVTATCRLDLGHTSGPSPARVAWVAHHARHDPALLGDSHAAALKREIVARIVAAHPAHRRDLYTRMHTLLAEVRAARADRLAAMEAAARDLAEHAGEEQLRLDRTWAFPLLDHTTLDAMQHEIARRIGGHA